MDFDKVDQRQMLTDVEPDRRRAPNPYRAAILEANKARRDSGAPPATLGKGRDAFGYVSMSIPLLDYQVLINRFPELNSKDPETHKRAWEKFTRDPASLIYRVDQSIGKRQRKTGVIVK